MPTADGSIFSPGNSLTAKSAICPPFITANIAAAVIRTVPNPQLSIYVGLDAKRLNSFFSSVAKGLAARISDFFFLTFAVPPDDVAILIKLFESTRYASAQTAAVIRTTDRTDGISPVPESPVTYRG